MDRATKTILIGALAVVTYDAAGAGASRLLGIRYGVLALGSYAIYSAVSYQIARESGIVAAIAAGAAIAFIDATLGWAISWAIGPGRPETAVTPILVLGTVFVVVISGAVFGLAAGFIARKKPSRVDA
jgi:ABC-type Co2+ transport system permease subunit